MATHPVSYEEHAAIYSAALLVLFRATLEFVPSLAVQLPQGVSRRGVIYCAGLCLLRNSQTHQEFTNPSPHPSYPSLIVSTHNVSTFE